MNSSINQSLNKIRLIESREQLSEAPAVAAPVAAMAGKGLGRFIPGVGAALGAYDAYGRAKKGDYAGAALSGAGGIASLIPGIGTAASIGIAGAQALRDKSRTGSYLPSDEEQTAAVAKSAQQPVAQASAQRAPGAPAVKGVNPQVLALQKQLIAKGARIRPDGIMGPATQAAMQQFPEIQTAGKINKIKGTYMSESEKIAALRARLMQIESQPVNEGPLDMAAKLGSKLATGAKGAWQAAKTGFSGAPVATGATTAGGKVAMTGQGSQVFKKALSARPGLERGAYAAGKGAKAVAPYAAGAALGVGGTLGAQALMSPGAKATGGGGRAGGAGGRAGGASSPMQISLDPSEMDELKSLAAEFGQSQDPATQAMMKQYAAMMAKIGSPAAPKMPADATSVGQAKEFGAANPENK
jgi:peptidoglycan hydrolase-like protein with peptidoglycan-binding domain